MMYLRSEPTAPLDQGDIIDDCPILTLAGFVPNSPEALEINHAFRRVVVLTQTCDLANNKATAICVATLLDAAALVAGGQLKASDVKGQIRATRVYGWYFLPAIAELGLAESIIDLRQPHTVRADVLLALCRQGKRRARIPPLYREHLGKHFGDTFSRIGLPEAYPTVD